MRVRFAPTLILALALLLAWSAPALAEDDQRTFPRGVWGLTIENDIIAGTDRDYTNGIRLDYISKRNELPALGRFARNNLGWLTDANDWYMTYAVGQNIFTPADISGTAPPGAP